MTMQEFKDLPAGDYSNTEGQRAAAAALVSRMPDADLLMKVLGLVESEPEPENPRHFRLCPKGQHRMVPSNTYDDGRRCKSCKVEADTLAAGMGTKYKFDAKCKNGHERTPENTIIQPDGLRRCLICRRAAARKFTKTRPPRDQKRTKCIHGHELSGDNVRVDARGARRCAACIGTREPWTRKRKDVDSPGQ